MSNLQVTILGCGSSGGVPLIGNIWGPCDPNDIRNTRRRVSILVKTNNKSRNYIRWNDTKNK